MSEDDEMTRCEQFGHLDERIRDEDETGATYECLACGAEWWDEYENDTAAPPLATPPDTRSTR